VTSSTITTSTPSSSSCRRRATVKEKAEEWRLVAKERRKVYCNFGSSDDE
jgi:hypothetical protein